MTPDPRQYTSETSEEARGPAPVPPHATWMQRVASVLFIVFCLELGLFLLIYPWTDSWAGNYFSWIGPLKLQPSWHQFWNNAYLRGAISGLGLVNVWVAVAEALRIYIGKNDGND